MDLFSEIYGVYYQLIHSILVTAPLTQDTIIKIIDEQGFLESTYEILPKLTSETWPFLEKKGDTYISKLKHQPLRPITVLEKRWLKALLNDAKIHLFLFDQTYLLLISSFTLTMWADILINLITVLLDKHFFYIRLEFVAYIHINYIISDITLDRLKKGKTVSFQTH